MQPPHWSGRHPESGDAEVLARPTPIDHATEQLGARRYLTLLEVTARR